MSRKSMIANLVGAFLLGVSAFAVQTAPVPMGDAAVAGSTTNIIEKAHYHHHRYHHHRYHHHRHHRHHGHRYW